jgi:hypothetical protein
MSLNFHPLLGDLKSLKDSDIEEKVSELSRKYMIAMKYGYNDVLYQIIAALDAYKLELQTRQQASLAAVNKNQNKELGNLIKVN